MRVKILSLVVFLILAGCATEQGFRKALDSWKGSSINELIQSDKFGTPYGSYEAEGYRYYIFREEYSGHYCKTDFKTKNGVIIDATYQGNRCTSR